MEIVILHVLCLLYSSTQSPETIGSCAGSLNGIE